MIRLKLFQQASLLYFWNIYVLTLKIKISYIKPDSKVQYFFLYSRLPKVKITFGLDQAVSEESSYFIKGFRRFEEVWQRRCQEWTHQQKVGFFAPPHHWEPLMILISWTLSRGGAGAGGRVGGETPEGTAWVRNTQRKPTIGIPQQYEQPELLSYPPCSTNNLHKGVHLSSTLFPAVFSVLFQKVWIKCKHV